MISFVIGEHSTLLLHFSLYRCVSPIILNLLYAARYLKWAFGLTQTVAIRILLPLNSQRGACSFTDTYQCQSSIQTRFYQNISLIQMLLSVLDLIIAKFESINKYCDY
jgi:hypothetical protein